MQPSLGWFLLLGLRRSVLTCAEIIIPLQSVIHYFTLVHKSKPERSSSEDPESSN